MDTPIVDFVRQYEAEGLLRLHMPGHKGIPRLGMEKMDITEISGADSLYEADGVIAKSEKNASDIFGCPTFYSTEGSSQCIRAMLHLATMGKSRVVAAARNVHKTFLSAAALLDLQVAWLYPGEGESYLSCTVEPEAVERLLRQRVVDALYVTSPDYLGNVADIAALAEVCHRYGTLLLVDNAHGAYLKFLAESHHPMDLGADLCCDSAHKTLPVLTGGAYLHIAPTHRDLVERGKDALALFGSTSPSYLILQSLDLFNSDWEFPLRVWELMTAVDGLKSRLLSRGWILSGDEPLKLTLCPKGWGYTGQELAAFLRQQGGECEFADPDYLVLMFGADNGMECVRWLEKVLDALPRKAALQSLPPVPSVGASVMSVREAMLSRSEMLPVEECVGRVLASPCVGCPPAVPILVCGERIDETAVDCFRYYGVDRCRVVDKCPSGA